MQAEIIELLKKQDKPLGRTEIAKLLKQRPEKITKFIKILIKHREIKFVEIDRFEAKIRFNARRKMRIYYV